MLRSWKLWRVGGLVRTVGSYLMVLSRHHLFHVLEMVTFIVAQGVDSKLGVESGKLIEGDRPVSARSDGDWAQYDPRNGGWV